MRISHLIDLLEPYGDAEIDQIYLKINNQIVIGLKPELESRPVEAVVSDDFGGSKDKPRLLQAAKAGLGRLEEIKHWVDNNNWSAITRYFEENHSGKATIDFIKQQIENVSQNPR